MPQSAGTAGPGSTTGAAIVAVPVPAVPASAASPAGGNGPSATGSGGASAAGSTPPGNPAADAAALSQAPQTPNGAVGTTSPVAQPNPPRLVAIVPNGDGPTGAATDPGPLVPTRPPLSSAIGGSTALAANPGAAGVILPPTPLSLPAPLPPIQSGRVVAGVPDAWSSGGQSTSGVLPASLPEPRSIVLFAFIACASAVELTLRRRRQRGSVGSGQVGQSPLQPGPLVRSRDSTTSTQSL